MGLIERLRAEIRTRGPAGFLRFVGTRLGQVRADVLFELRLPRSSVAASPLDRVVRVDRSNLGSEATAAVEQTVLSAGNFAYRVALEGADMLFAATDDGGHVTSYGFVLFESFHKRVLGETTEVPMIGNCFTVPSHRGQGLYSRLLVTMADELAGAGFARVIITCSADNVASARGIRKAGFRHVRTLRSFIALARWIVFQTTVTCAAATDALDCNTTPSRVSDSNDDFH